MGDVMKSPIWIGLAALLCACGQKPAAADGAAGTGVPDAAQKSAAGASVQGAALPQALPQGVIVLQRVKIQDPGVIAPGTAMTALVPQGWTTRGGVAAPEGLCKEPFVFDWRAASPDDTMSVGIFPTETWAWTNFQARGDCPTGEHASVRDYLSARIAQTAPDARVLDFRPRPDFAGVAADYAKAAQAMWAGINPNMRVRAEGGELLYAYAQNGVEMRGVLAATAIFYQSESANPMAQNPEMDFQLGGQPFRTLVGSTLGTFMATAPNGRLDFDLAEAVRRSLAPDPEWLTQLFKLKARIGEIQTEGVRERAAIIVAGGAAATQSNIESFRRMAGGGGSGGGGTNGELYPGEATGDRMHRENIEAVRGVETYFDPVDNSRVQLDANYDHAWRVNNQDAYILTKDPNFNPGQYGLDATQLGVVQ